VKLVCASVRQIVVEKCDGETPERFEKVMETELANRKGLQKETHAAVFKAKWVKLILVSGWDNFAAVARVSLE
jgi:ketopantoate reductase